MGSSLEAKHLTKLGTKLVVNQIIEEVAYEVLVRWSLIGEMLKVPLIVLLLFELGETGIECFKSRHDL
jgi:hypothetical protein